MTNFKRRDFIKAGSIAALGGMAIPSIGANKLPNQTAETNEQVNFTRDGLDLSPRATAALLLELTKDTNFNADVYSRGAIVSDFEAKFAKSLGKEASIYMPSGTLANHIALRALSKGKGKILLQQQSHIYLDSGDMAQKLSSLNLVPLAFNQTQFNLEEVQQVYDETQTEKVNTGISVISMESSIRRKREAVFDFSEMKKIAAFARNKNIKLHFDGARLFTSSVYTGVTPKEYAALFDTIYVSLYKYYNTISGAMLAGPKSIIDDLYHERRMFGGGLRSVWENIVIADYYFDGFQDRFKKVVQKGEDLFDELNTTKKFKIEKINNGSTVYKLSIPDTDLGTFRNNIISSGVKFPTPTLSGNCFYIKVNESQNYLDNSALKNKFLEALN